MSTFFLVLRHDSYTDQLPPKNISYRDYKNFNQNEFLYELDQEMIKGKFYNEKDQYESFSNLFKKVVDKHAPIKHKMVLFC